MRGAAVSPMSTDQREKSEYLRNALLNIATGKSTDEVKQQIFLNAIEAFAPAHVKALDVMWRGAGWKIPWDQNSIGMRQRNYGAAIGVLAPELKGQADVIGAVIAELRNRGLSNLSGPDLSFPQGGQITGLGAAFMNFVLSPEDLAK